MCGLKSWEIACKNTVTHSFHQETNSIWFGINKHKQKHNFLNWRAEEPCKRDQKKKVCIQLSSCLLLPFRKIFTSSNASSGGKSCSIYPPCSARLMYILLHTAAPLLVHLSWGLPAALPKHIWPPCLPFPTASSTAPTTADELKWQRKVPPPVYSSCKYLLQGSSLSVPRSSLVLYKETNHRTGTKQIKSSYCPSWQEQGLWQGCFTTKDVNDGSPADSLLWLPTCGQNSSTDTNQKQLANA